MGLENLTPIGVQTLNCPDCFPGYHSIHMNEEEFIHAFGRKNWPLWSGDEYLILL
jgi:hypothetical protein